MKNKNYSTSTSTSTGYGGGIGFCGLLTILFIGLKLTGYVAWSWFWVVFPVTVWIMLAGVVLAVIGIFYGIKKILGWG